MLNIVIITVGVVLGFLIGLVVAGYRQEMENINRQIEIQHVLRNIKTDVVDDLHWFSRNDGYEVFRVNQN